MMTPGLVAAALMACRWMFNDPFVKLAVVQPVLPAYGVAAVFAVGPFRRACLKVLASILAGAAVPVIALLGLPSPYAVPMAAFSAFTVCCDWLMMFSGARVRIQWVREGLYITPSPPLIVKWGVSADRIVREMCLIVALMFFGLAFS